jgi:hypothetical protein
MLVANPFLVGLIFLLQIKKKFVNRSFGSRKL